ncbi:hypothetical protein COV58_04555 [Candidatus Roizmanbacteria bacterium CG11_big_fil_rev_8_21_14_0_20_36_8]|uniref:EamA domain-containing protein n=2 Tax=Candidatus Roizmaniibacteriota TaxID=1752723 RepID=A0A2M6IT59_9BACT|nr:MAG: hypothetical protein COV58_04555 [Candidatus Roizmanbacteria bacterium CG11_big_fil_rev_8_21_14_0_20_36_8]PIZ64825.1 MAG: hypothetical protein COY14_03735 [Candidatus Roizmanbacteria bacterium CG_4_10_14_0_2_um_filter_36_9]
MVGAAIISYGVFERGRFYAAKLLDASTMTVIGNLVGVISFLASIFLYSEALTGEKILGSILVLFSLILVTYHDNSAKNVSLKGVLIAIIISIFAGIAVSFDKAGATYFNPALYSLVMWTFPILFVLFPSIPLLTLKREVQKTTWKIPFLALINIAAYYFMLSALKLHEATMIIPILQTSTIWTVVLGILILHERENMWKKILAALVGFIGVVFLVW